jgi:hypothetical protein
MVTGSTSTRAAVSSGIESISCRWVGLIFQTSSTATGFACASIAKCQAPSAAIHTTAAAAGKGSR